MPYSWITSFTGGSTRNSQTGPAGIDFIVGSNALVVTALGRWTVSGNSQSHYINLSTADVGSSPTTLATVTINTSGLPVGFGYVNLATPFIIYPGRKYSVMSQEIGAGDFNYNNDTTMSVTADATWVNSCFLTSGATGVLAETAGASYGGSNFLYEIYSNVTGGAPRMTTWSY
jgi:hypothetical protein